MSTNDSIDMKQTKEVMISTTALAKFLAVDHVDITTESAGVLIGYEDDLERLIITDFDTGKQQQTTTFVVMDDNALIQIVEDLQKRGRENETIVGWIHSHPGYGCFLSGTDKGTQRVYQSLYPKAVALVVDPSRYYTTMDKNDLELQFFRMINDIDYRAIEFDVFIDDQSNFISSFIESNKTVRWNIPQLSNEQVAILHKKLQGFSHHKIDESDENLLHGFIDVLQQSQEKTIETKEEQDFLVSIDNRLEHISDKIKRVYDKETSILYSILNILSVVIILISWFLIHFFS